MLTLIVSARQAGKSPSSRSRTRLRPSGTAPPGASSGHISSSEILHWRPSDRLPRIAVKLRGSWQFNFRPGLLFIQDERDRGRVGSPRIRQQPSIICARIVRECTTDGSETDDRRKNKSHKRL